LLSRGDPEQPKDEVVPAVLGVLGEPALVERNAGVELRLPPPRSCGVDP
jgi:hypothetical protein